MSDVKNPSMHKLLARGVGALLLISFAVGVVSVYGAPAVNAETLAGDTQALAAGLHKKALFEWISAALTLAVGVGFFLITRFVSFAAAVFALAFRIAEGALKGWSAFANGRMARLSEKADGAPEVLMLNDKAWDAFHFGLVLFAIAMIITYALLFRSRFIPRLLSGYGAAASAFVIVGVLVVKYAPAVSDFVYPWYPAANALAFVSLTLWLLIMGVDVSRWNAQTGR